MTGKEYESARRPMAEKDGVKPQSQRKSHGDLPETCYRSLKHSSQYLFSVNAPAWVDSSSYCPGIISGLRRILGGLAAGPGRVASGGLYRRARQQQSSHGRTHGKRNRPLRPAQLLAPEDNGFT
ncbi:hypothetical protein ABVT39_012199 [Epinephelus coioides]